MEERRLRYLVRLGVVEPSRTERRELRFTFQDLVLLRAAKGLLDAEIPPRRVQRALQRLPEQLPSGRSLTAVRITAAAGDIVVQAGDRRWNPESGQAILSFDVAELADAAAPLAPELVREVDERADSADAEAWFELGCELEASSLEEAERSYRKALALDPDHPDAHLNLGRLLHEARDLAGAEVHYGRTLALRPDDPIAAYNLGVALEDQRRLDEARVAYETAVAADPAHADAYFNLAGVYEALGHARQAIATLKRYRELVGSGPTRVR